MSWTVYGKALKTRLILGTARYPSPDILKKAIVSSGVELVTVSLRRLDPTREQKNSFWEIISETKVNVLPNTAGCRTAKEAITTATLARELFGTKWIKLEVIGDEYTLQPDPWGLVEAAEALVKQGFEVFPYTTDDLVLADKLVQVGCQVLMPWGSPIGSGKGLLNPYALRALRARFPKLNMIVDAGIGKPSQAMSAMELGFDGVLVNTAVALADDPVAMAESFSMAVLAGRKGYHSGLMPERDFAVPSTPVLGTPFRSDR